jgi:hypothetical protein
MKHLFTKSSKTLMMVESSSLGGGVFVRLTFGSSLVKLCTCHIVFFPIQERDGY